MCFSVLALFIGLSVGSKSAAAQMDKKPLYNSQALGGSKVYNSGARARPLSLKQMLSKSSRSATRSTASVPAYKPFRQNNYSAGYSSSVSGVSDIEAFRAEQAARARVIEEQARTSFLAYNNPAQDQTRDEQTKGYLDKFKSSESGTSGTAPRRVYKQRNKDALEEPRRLFNSIR